MKFLLEYSDLNFLTQVGRPYCVSKEIKRKTAVGLSKPPTYLHASWDLSVGFCTIDSKSPTQNRAHNLCFQTHLQLPGVVFFPPFPILS